MDRWPLGQNYEAVVAGVSAGGFDALSRLVPALPARCRVPVVVVQHRTMESDDFLARHLDSKSAVRVKQAEDKEPLVPATVYIAPAGYHLLIENEREFSLSVDPPVCFSRPSIDVLFESAADAYGERLIGIVLTGANSDGSLGLKKIADRGGLTIVQDPASAEAPTMPIAALSAAPVHRVLSLDAMVALFAQLQDGVTS
jgi:two-component system chemotaxis response regulator CheB